MGRVCLSLFFSVVLIYNFFLADLLGSESTLFNNRESRSMRNDWYDKKWKVGIISFPFLMFCWCFVHFVLNAILSICASALRISSSRLPKQMTVGVALQNIQVNSCYVLVLGLIKLILLSWRFKKKNKCSSERHDLMSPCTKGHLFTCFRILDISMCYKCPFST